VHDAPRRCDILWHASIILSIYFFVKCWAKCCPENKGWLTGWRLTSRIANTGVLCRDSTMRCVFTAGGERRHLLCGPGAVTTTLLQATGPFNESPSSTEGGKGDWGLCASPWLWDPRGTGTKHLCGNSHNSGVEDLTREYDKALNGCSPANSSNLSDWDITTMKWVFLLYGTQCPRKPGCQGGILAKCNPLSNF